MQNLTVKHQYTLEEYAKLEKSSEERLEYIEGDDLEYSGRKQ